MRKKSILTSPSCRFPPDEGGKRIRGKAGRTAINLLLIFATSLMLQGCEYKDTPGTSEPMSTETGTETSTESPEDKITPIYVNGKLIHKDYAVEIRNDSVIVDDAFLTEVLGFSKTEHEGFITYENSKFYFAFYPGKNLYVFQDNALTMAEAVEKNKDGIRVCLSDILMDMDIVYTIGAFQQSSNEFHDEIRIIYPE